MTEFARLDIRVDSSSAREATGELDRLGRQARTTERAFADLVKTAAAGVLGTVGVAAIAREADAYANLSVRIKLVTSSEEQFNAVRRQVIAISMRTGGELSATTDLYTKMARSVKGAQATQQNFLTVTETINKALAVSGTTGQAAEGVIRQLGQGLASGALRGDEFNSVMEGAPILMEAVAKSMGTTTGALRTLAADGKLTSDVLVKALLKAGKDIDAQFAQMPLTISRASAELKTAFTVYIGTADQAAGASRATANAISLVANNFDSIANAILAVAVVAGGRYVVGMVAATRATVAAAVAARGLGGAIAGIFGGIPGLILTVAGLALSFVDFGKAAEEAKDPAEAITPPLDEIGRAAKEAQERLDNLTQSLNRASTARLRNEVNKLRDALAEVERATDSARIKYAKGEMGGMDFAKQLAELGRARRQMQEGERILLERESKKGSLSEREGKDGKKAEDQRKRDADERKRLADEADRELDAEIGAAQKRTDAAEQSERELEGMRTQIAIDGARARGDVLTAEQMEIERKFAALKDKLLANGGTDADVSALESVMGFEKARPQLEQFERDLARVKAEAAAGKENLKIGRESGNIGQGEFKQGVADIDAGMMAEIDGMIAKAKELGIVLPKAFADASREAGKTDQVMKITGASAADLAMNFSAGLSNAIMDVANGTKSAGEAFREFAAQFLAQIAQMIIQQMIFNALKGSFGFAEGGLVAGFASGGYTGDGGKYQPAGVVHRGEYVIPKHIVEQPGSLEFLRQYHAVGTKALPKYPGFADGGLVSAYSPETMPAATTPAAGANVSMNQKQVILFDKDLAAQEIATSRSFEQAVLTVVGMNPTTIRSRWDS